MLRKLMGVAAKAALPLALECDDVHLLKRVALGTDTVLATIDAAVRDELASGELHMLHLPDLPPLYSEMGVVSLTGRSYSPMAEFAVEFLSKLARQQAR